MQPGLLAIISKRVFERDFPHAKTGDVLPLLVGLALLALLPACGHSPRAGAKKSLSDRCWEDCYQDCTRQVRSEHIPCASRCNDRCSGCSELAGLERYCACLLRYGAGESRAACPQRYLQQTDLALQQSVLAPSGPLVRARIKEVMPSRESALYVTAQLVFSNRSGRVMRVTRYKILWPGGSLVLEPKDLGIPAQGVAERTVRISPGAGALDALGPSNGRVELLEVSPAR